MQYKINKDNMGISLVKIDDDVISFIPFDEGNVDYQQYLIDTDGGLPLPE